MVSGMIFQRALPRLAQRPVAPRRVVFGNQPTSSLQALPPQSQQAHVQLPRTTPYTPPYPKTVPYKTHRINVSEGHQLYVAEYGNPNGKPIIALHGGPGSGGSLNAITEFDPAVYRVIFFDQRGSGRSTPLGGIKGNTTPNLVKDMETIRKQLGIGKWAITGYSWGATLALAYAQAYPDKVTAMVIGAVYLGHKESIDWLYKGGAGHLFPDMWEKTLSVLEPHQRKPDKLIQAFFEKIQIENDPRKRDMAINAWNRWEGVLIPTAENKVSNRQPLDTPTTPDELASALITCHYAKENNFLKPNQLLNNMDKIRHIPIWIVQGRNDWVCPFKQAWDVHKALPKSQLIEVEDAYHWEASISAAAFLALEAMKSALGSGHVSSTIKP